MKPEEYKNCTFKEVKTFGRIFADVWDGEKIRSVKVAPGQIEINFKDGSTIIHSGSYQIDFIKG